MEAHQHCSTSQHGDLAHADSWGINLKGSEFVLPVK